MADRPAPVDPIVSAVAFAIRRAVERRAREEAERRAKLTPITDERSGGRAA